MEGNDGRICEVVIEKHFQREREKKRNLRRWKERKTSTKIITRNASTN
jgi:hypothetical protein